jgi:hypothetical protein
MRFLVDNALSPPLWLKGYAGWDMKHLMCEITGSRALQMRLSSS